MNPSPLLAHDPRHEIRQLSGGFDPFSLALRIDRQGNTASARLLPILPQYPL